MTNITLVNGQSITASSATIVDGASVTATVTGLGDTINLTGDGSDLTVIASAQASNVGNVITVVDPGGGTVGDIITLQDVSGTTTGTQGSLDITGNGMDGAPITVNYDLDQSADMSVNIEQNSNVIINGSNIFDALFLQGNDTLAIAGQNEDIVAYGNDSVVNLNASTTGTSLSDSVKFLAGGSGNVLNINTNVAVGLNSGFENTINIYAANGVYDTDYGGSYINLYGQSLYFSYQGGDGFSDGPENIISYNINDTINIGLIADAKLTMSNGTVDLSDSTLVLNGSNDDLNFWNGNSSSTSATTLTVNGNFETITIGTFGNFGTCNADITGKSENLIFDINNAILSIGQVGQTVSLILGGAQKSTFTMAGIGNNVDLAGSGSQLTLDSSSYTAIISGQSFEIFESSTSSVSASIGSGSNFTDEGSGNTFALGGGVAATAGGDTFAIASGQSDAINGNGNTIDASSGDTLNLGSSIDDIFNLGNNDTLLVSNNTLTIPAGDTETIEGSGNIINAGAGGVLSLSGGSGNTVNLAASSSLTLNAGAGNTINLGNEDTIAVSNSTLDISANSTETISGGSDTLNTPEGGGVILNLAAGSSVTDDGSGNTVNLGNNVVIQATGDTVVVGTGLADTINGNANAVNGAANSTIAIAGAGNTLNDTGSGDTVNVSANGQGEAADYLNFASGGVVNEASGTSINAYGSAIRVDANGSDDLGLYGANNTANIDGAGSQVWTGGNGQGGPADYFNFSSGGVLNAASGASVNAYGSAITVYASGSDNLGLYGASDTANINGAGSQVWAGGNGQGGATDYVNFSSGGVLNEASGANVNTYGNAITVHASGSDDLGLYGTGDTANINGAGSEVWAGGNGQGGATDYVNFSSGGVLNEASGANVNAYGNALTVYASGSDDLGLYGANDTANINGAGSQAWAGGNGQNGATDYFNFSSGGVLNEASGASVNAYGNAITAYASGSDDLGLYGASDTANINGAGSQVWAGGNGQSGTADYFNFADGGTINEAANASINAYGAGIAIKTGNSDDLGIYGTGATVSLGSGDNVWAGDGSDTFVLGGKTGQDVISGFVTTGADHDTLQFSTSVFANWAHLLDATKQQGSDLAITIDAGDTVILKNTTLASFTSADAHFV